MDNDYEVRTASKFDVDLIGRLFSSSKAKYFGDKRGISANQLFYEYQTHRLVAHAKDRPDKLLSYSEFCIYPNIPVLSNDCWPQWLKCRFCIDVPLTLMNTMFFNFYMFMPDHEEMLLQVIKEVFFREHKIIYLIVARPPNYSIDDYEELETFGKVYFPSSFDMYAGKHLPTIIVITRTTFMPVISFRKALPEDNDDVIEMIDVEEPEMREKHGDYFIAEVLLGAAASGQSMEGDKIIVTEEASSSVVGSTGMMWLSEDVNIERLVINFDLESLGNLVNCSPDMPHARVQIPVFTAEQRQYFKIKPYEFDPPAALLSMRGRARSLQQQDYKVLYETVRLYSKLKFISDELHNRSNYLDKVKETLTIHFDVPSMVTGRRSVMRKKLKLDQASSAFSLKNFILHPSLRLEYTYYYLGAMFSAYPDRDFCVVPIPPGQKYSAGLWALLKFFIRVRHRPSSEVADEVFVAHRSSINTELSIYRFAKEDIADVYRLLRNINKSNVGQKAIRAQRKLVGQIISDVLINRTSEFSIWMIRCGQWEKEMTTTVGFAILRPFSDYESVYKQFMLPYDEDNMIFERGELVLLRLHPYFHMWSDEVLRTVALRSGYREIFYIHEMASEDLANDLAQKMMPVEPRRQRRNWFISEHDDSCYRRSSVQVNLSKINCVFDQFYLFRHNLCPSRYIGNQNPIVIVGFSDVCKAFLRLMVFGWNTADFKNVSVNNCLPLVEITVVLRHGEIEAEYDPHVQCQFCVRKEDCYLSTANTCPFVSDTTQRLDMRNYINFVPGHVEYIDRAEKQLVLDNGCRIYYDKLLLLCDTKFGPDYVDLDLETEKPDDCQQPYNYAQINARLDKIELYHKMIEFKKMDLAKKKIVIYGNNLAVFECINFLLRHDCEPEEITYVQPLRVAKPEYLNNPTTDRNVIDILGEMVEDLGVTLIDNTNFVRFRNYADVCYIEAVEFKKIPSGEELIIPCQFFINFADNYMPPKIERMLDQSNIIVENHAVMVDENYQTNDPHIYAAGMHASIKWDVYYQYTHTNEYELAQKLIDTLGLSQEPISKDKRFSKPFMFHALLPLNHEIMKITVPKRYIMNKLPNEYSRFMTTFKGGTFFRVRLSNRLVVEELVCVSYRQKVPMYHLEYFCGKHQSLLNNVYNRWQAGKIPNFRRFFEEPWTEYIMHDRFEEMHKRNHEVLLSLMQHMQTNVGSNVTMGDTDFDVACKQFLETNFIKYLRKYRAEFVNTFALPEDWNNANI